LSNTLEELKAHDRHLAVDEDSGEEILEWIEPQAKKCKPVTRTDIWHYYKAKYSRLVSRGWVGSFILCHRDNLTKIKSISQEDPILEVPCAFLDDTIYFLREYVQRMKEELVFNFDEVAMSEWEDRKDKRVIVLKTMDGQTIHYRTLQKVKHISIITCTAVGGESLTLYIVAS
jgi:hypothetical protein